MASILAYLTAARLVHAFPIGFVLLRDTLSLRAEDYDSLLCLNRQTSCLILSQYCIVRHAGSLLPPSLPQFYYCVCFEGMVAAARLWAKIWI